MPGVGNATILEMAWTALALFGLGLDLRLAFLIRRSRRRLRNRGIRGIRERVNRTRQRGRDGHLIGFVCLALVGVAAMLTPPPVRLDNEVMSVFSGVVLVNLLLRMVYDSIRDSLDRERAMGQIVDQAFSVKA